MLVFGSNLSERIRGVPDETKEKIFGRYEQVEQADGRAQQGTGLGLMICKQIVERHGGSIGVEDAQDGGSIFWVNLLRGWKRSAAPASAKAALMVLRELC